MSDILVGNIQNEGVCVGVVMAGGSGTRFWPLSRTNYPKQFLPLGGGDRSLIQATIDRISPLCGPGGSLVVTASHQANLVVQQLPSTVVLSEPMARNTAACIGYAAGVILDSVGDVPMLCLPADHVVHGQQQILDVYSKGIELAKASDVLVTIGIRPTLPETGYGYIEVDNFSQDGAAKVKNFVEKPDRATAESYLAAGNYFWNSGMFIWRPSVILNEIKKHLPQLSEALEKIREAMRDGIDDEAVASLYADLESVSIDVGVMERSDDVVMLSGEGFMWSDVGSWSSWAEVQKDRLEESNVDNDSQIVEGEGVAVACRDVTILSKSRFVAAVGVSDVIIVDTDDAVLVCARQEAQRVKEVVQFLSDSKRDELL